MKFLLLLIFFLVFPTGHSIKCWTCESDRACDNPRKIDCGEEGVEGPDAACFSGPRGLSCVYVKDCGVPVTRGNATVVVVRETSRWSLNPFASGQEEEPRCCQTDYCNGAGGNYEKRNWFVLIVTSLLVTFW